MDGDEGIRCRDRERALKDIAASIALCAVQRVAAGSRSGTCVYQVVRCDQQKSIGNAPANTCDGVGISSVPLTDAIRF